MTPSGFGFGYEEPISGLDWNDATYIGDGVYAHYDGYQAWLLVQRYLGQPPHVIALPPSVLPPLAAFVARVMPVVSHDD